MYIGGIITFYYKKMYVLKYVVSVYVGIHDVPGKPIYLISLLLLFLVCTVILYIIYYIREYAEWEENNTTPTIGIHTCGVRTRAL